MLFKVGESENKDLKEWGESNLAFSLLWNECVLECAVKSRYCCDRSLFLRLCFPIRVSNTTMTLSLS